MRNTGKQLTLIGFFLGLTLGLCNPGWSAVSASLDRTQVKLGDSLSLTLSATDGEDVNDVDLDALRTDFSILGRSSSSNISISNGRRQSLKQLIVSLSPKREGLLSIPAFNVDGQHTQALSVTVEPPPAPGAPDEMVRFEASVDKDSVYVQEQLILTLHIYLYVALSDSGVSELKIDNAFVKPLEQKSYRRNDNGREAIVYELRYAIFPQQSGTLHIPQQQFSASTGGNRRLFSRGRPGQQLRRATQALNIEVKPRPPAFTGVDWLPATDLTLHEQWSKDPATLKAGESITRTVQIKADGLQGIQLPALDDINVQGMSLYPDQADTSDQENGSGISGQRTQSIAFIAQNAGTYDVPAQRVIWWDVKENRQRETVLPAKTITVSGSVAAATTAITTPMTPAPVNDVPTPKSAPPANNYWPWATGFAFLGWFLSVMYLLKRGVPRPPSTANNSTATSEKTAWRTLQAACKTHNAAAARSALQVWFQSQDKALTPSADPAIKSALQTLESVLYGDRDNPSWRGDALLQACQQWRADQANTATPDWHLYPR